MYAYSIEMEGRIRVGVTIDKIKKLPDGEEPALGAELLRRLSQNY